MKIEPLQFKPVLELFNVDVPHEKLPIIRYKILDNTFMKVQRGVYLVSQKETILYCGKFSNTFSKRWLYAKFEYIYHFKRPQIAKAIMNNGMLTVFAESEAELKKQLNTSSEWVDVNSIEANLIRKLKPQWNLISNKEI